jgi:peptidoglycan-N-acetylglucosamine deacetylase
VNVFSVDLEEWFHINDAKWLTVEEWNECIPRIEHNTYRLLKLLESAQVKATFFTMGWVAERYPGLVKDIYDLGHEIGYHSYYHDFPSTQSVQAFEEDLLNGLEAIEKCIGIRPRVYRAPNLSLDSNSIHILPILVKHGIQISSSTRSHRIIQGHKVPNRPFLWTFQNSTLLEFPVNRISLFSKAFTFTGSGYFRIMPYRLTRQLFKADPYNFAYFHPNDIDSNHPTDKRLGFLRNWMNKVGTPTCQQKIEKLLLDVDFMNLSEAANQYRTSEKSLQCVSLRIG